MGRGGGGVARTLATLLLGLALVVGAVLYFQGRPPANHYEALGLYRTASDADIKAAFRRTALQHHPDKHPGDEAALKRFHALVDAKDVLLDPEKRAEYDRELMNPARSQQQQQRQQQQRQRQQQQYDQQQQQHQEQRNRFGGASWDCETATCWWFTYIRDTFWQYLSLGGAVRIVFLLGVGTVIVDWALPFFSNLVRYVLCDCIWLPLTRTKAKVAADRQKQQDMQARMRQRWAAPDGAAVDQKRKMK